MMRITPSRVVVALLLAAVAIMLQAPDAFAIADDVSSGSFSCSGGTPSGQLFVSGGSCPTTLTMDNLFSFLICNMEQLSSNVMGYMYCGMIQQLAPSVMAAVALATAIYGIGFTIGIIPATGQEAMKFLLKIAFVMVFATNADYLIGIAYNGLLGFISAGTKIAISLMTASSVSSGADVYKALDGFLGTMVHYATDMVSATKDEDMCKNALFAVIGTMFVVFPLMAYFGMLLVARVVMTFFRAVFAYVYAIVSITFLLLLAPFFVTFYLFTITRNLFDRWLGYLVSFTLQVVLLFCFLGFIFAMDLSNNNVVKNLVNIIIFQSERAETTSIRLPFQYCTLCDFKVVDKDDESKELKPDVDKEKYITNGKLICKDSPGKPIRPTFATSPDSKGQINALINFAGNGVLSLVVLAMVIEHLLKLIPSLAQKLGSSMGAGYAAQLGGGYAPLAPSTALPFESLVNDFTAGFNQGFQRKGGADSISATVQGVTDGLSALVTGKRSDQKSTRGIYGDAAGDPNNPSTVRQQGAGLGGAFERYISDPTRFGS